jgi:hypothetical protein
VKKPVGDVKPWSADLGALIGAVCGAILWLVTYEPAAGLFQNWKLIVFPALLGIVIVSFRNMRKKVGPWDPKNRDPQP